LIQLQFVLGHALSSSLIAWFSSGHFSHVDCVMPDGYLVGAQSSRVDGYPEGVRRRRAHYTTWKRRVVFDVPATAAQKKKFYAFLTAQIGKPYDHQAILGFVLGRDWREDDSWICSELQAAALEHAGIVPQLYLAANKITPVALALAISAIGCKSRS
jgi:uncharacterized protein YycO